MSNVPFNVLSQDCLDNQNAMDQITSLINSYGGNRSQRRLAEKTIKKATQLSQKAQDKLEQKIYKEYQDSVDKNFVHFFSILALVLEEDYHWKEDETHDQISSMLERVGNKLNKYAAMGYSTEDLSRLVEDRLGLVLIPDKH